MGEIQKRFEALGEYYAAGLFEMEGHSPFLRFSRALRRYFEHYKLPPYIGKPLYPYGSKEQGLMVFPDYSYTVGLHRRRLEEADGQAAAALAEMLSDYHRPIPPQHRVGGTMYTHSYPNFARIIREGLNSYERRVREIADADIREGLLDLLAGIRIFHGRVLEQLREAADTELYKALLRVPFEPAHSLYEAMVCRNFVYYLDGCDNIGSPDTDVYDYYRGEDMREVFRCFFENVNANSGWSGTLGPAYNELTLQCLQAIKGLRRPSLELRVTPDMPQEIWNAALEAICAGGGSPGLYNEQGYQAALARLFPDIPQEDRLRFAGGGCTETMLAGISNVGSLDAGINLMLILEEFMKKELPGATDFESFYGAFLQKCSAEISAVLSAISHSQQSRAKYRPQPMRTLLVDDCIEKGKDFNNGGARYYWSVVNLAGMINVIDSLSAIKTLVFTEGKMSGEELLQQLKEGADLLRFKSFPRHGRDDEAANAMAHRVSADLCAAFEGKVPYLGGKFLPSSIQFVTYVDAGKGVGATPDGRKAGAPLCDSIGAIHGADDQGITALLNSAAALCQDKMTGTPVLNVTLSPQHTAKYLQALALGYFQKGGMQMQISCYQKEELLAAREHPEQYPNLIVRVGGYSEYFRNLSPALQQTVIDRIIHEL